MTTAPEPVESAIAAWLRACDEAHPGLLERVYVTGSVVLGDFRPGASDVDIVVLDAPQDAHRDLERIARRTGGRRPNTLVNDPFLQLHFATSDGLDELGEVELLTLHRYGRAVRGPAPATVFPDVTHAQLAQAMSRNLTAYWEPWLERARLSARMRRLVLHREQVMWAVLGVPRQYYSVAEGDVTSKSAAARYVRDLVDERWHRILDEATRLRAGESGRRYASPVKRRGDALAFLEYAIAQTRQVIESYAPG